MSSVQRERERVRGKSRVPEQRFNEAEEMRQAQEQSIQDYWQKKEQLDLKKRKKTQETGYIKQRLEAWLMTD